MRNRFFPLVLVALSPFSTFGGSIATDDTGSLASELISGRPIALKVSCRGTAQHAFVASAGANQFAEAQVTVNGTINFIEPNVTYKAGTQTIASVTPPVPATPSGTLDFANPGKLTAHISYSAASGLCKMYGFPYEFTHSVLGYDIKTRAHTLPLKMDYCKGENLRLDMSRVKSSGFSYEAPGHSFGGNLLSVSTGANTAAYLPKSAVDFRFSLEKIAARISRSDLGEPIFIPERTLGRLVAFNHLPVRVFPSSDSTDSFEMECSVGGAFPVPFDRPPSPIAGGRLNPRFHTGFRRYVAPIANSAGVAFKTVQVFEDGRPIPQAGWLGANGTFFYDFGGTSGIDKIVFAPKDGTVPDISGKKYTYRTSY